jgi:hypothetical protein
MNIVKFFGLVGLGLLLASAPVAAMDNGHKGGKHNQGDPGAAAPQSSPPAASAKEPWLKANVTFSAEERHAILTYVDQCNASPSRGPKAKRLPPGLAKKVERGGDLPAGWRKRCVPGRIMPKEVFEHSHPLPPEVVVKLPPPPPDTVTITVGGNVVRLVKATLEILDVFDVHVRL